MEIVRHRPEEAAQCRVTIPACLVFPVVIASMNQRLRVPLHPIQSCLVELDYPKYMIRYDTNHSIHTRINHYCLAEVPREVVKYVVYCFLVSLRCLGIHRFGIFHDPRVVIVLFCSVSVRVGRRARAVYKFVFPLVRLTSCEAKTRPAITS